MVRAGAGLAFQLQPGTPVAYAVLGWRVRVTLAPSALALTASLGRSLQMRTASVLAPFEAARGPARVLELYYGVP